MVHAIFVLSRARLHIFKNEFWRGKLRQKIGWLALTALLGFGSWLIYSIVRAIVEFLRGSEFREMLEAVEVGSDVVIPSDIGPYIAAVPSVLLFAALAMLILTSFSTVLSSLYLSGDLDMLMVAPVPMRAVFVVKLFGGLLVPYVMLFSLLGPALVGYGQGLGYGLAFFITALVVLLLFPLLPVGLGALLVILVVRVVPAKRARDIVGVFGAIIGIAWYLASQLSNQIAPRLANLETLDNLRRLDLPVLPSAWAGRALVAAGEGAWLTLGVYGGLFVLVSLGIFVACLLISERLYYIGWSNISTQGGKPRGQEASGAEPKARSGPFDRLLNLLPLQMRAVIMKDLRAFPRDIRNTQQLLFPLAIAALWTIQLLGVGRERILENPEVGASGSVLALIGISTFLSMAFSSVLGGQSISREGSGFWLLKTAPISGMRLLLSKWVLAYLPYLVAGPLFALVLGLVLRLGFLDLLTILGMDLLLGAGLSGIILGIGATFPKFQWDTPRRQESFAAGCLTPICYILYVGLMLGLIFGLPMLAAALFPDWGLTLTISGWLLALFLTLGVIWGLLSLGAARLEQIEI